MGRLFAKFFGASFEQETPTGAVDGSNTAFTLSLTPASNLAVILNLDNLVLVQGVDYTIAGLNITMITVPQLGQSLYASYLKAT